MKDELGDFKLSSQAKAKLKNKKLLKQEIEKGLTAQEIIGFSDESMAKFYGAAYKIFEHKRYKDAANAFLFLATLNPYNHEYWLGLGMASQLSQDYEAAIDAYELAALTDIASPVPYFYLAKCLFSMHDRESALQALNLAIDASDGLEQYSELKREAEVARALLVKDEFGIN